jgi:hypothetical protein
MVKKELKKCKKGVNFGIFLLFFKKGFEIRKTL